MVSTWRVRTLRSQLLSVSVVRRKPAVRNKLVVSTRPERLSAPEAVPPRLLNQMESFPFRGFSLHLERVLLTVHLLVQLLCPFPDRPTVVIPKRAAPSPTPSLRWLTTMAWTQERWSTPAGVCLKNLGQQPAS